MIKHWQLLNHAYHFIKKTPSNMSSLLFLYRYASLILTSIFFLIGPQAPLVFKMGVVVSLTIAAGIITNLQKRYLGNTAILKLIVLTETLGLTLLLIPTGGISSPFIWYVLNPVLVGASFLSTIFCWGALAFYLGSATLIAIKVLHKDNIILIFEEKSYFYLVCFLTTLLTRLFSGLTKELNEKATQLKDQQQELIKVNLNLSEINHKYQHTLEHVMSLYQLLENQKFKKSPDKIADEITTSLIKCTESEAAFFWLSNRNQRESHLVNSTELRELEADLIRDWSRIRGKKGSFTYQIRDQLFWMRIIRTSYYVGVVGITVSGTSEPGKIVLMNRPFEFLTELSEIMIERIHIDQIIDQIMIVEEQNRIANEIHDSVSQRLFGMVYALHSLQLKSQQLTIEELHQEFQFLSDTANTTLKELRSAIYRLSTTKKGHKPFLIRLKKFLDEFSRLNDIKVNYQITGDEALLLDTLTQPLYRIICEACGNAVRHGECDVIELRLSINADKVILTIHDDGIGFNSGEYRATSNNGIGINNMQSIVKSFYGTFTIQGSRGVGTDLQIEIPNVNLFNRQEVIG